jgi:hypothetical protein
LFAAEHVHDSAGRIRSKRALLVLEGTGRKPGKPGRKAMADQEEMN